MRVVLNIFSLAEKVREFIQLDRIARMDNACITKLLLFYKKEGVESLEDQDVAGWTSLCIHYIGDAARLIP